MKVLPNETSTKTYINADVVSELGLEGIPRKGTVNVLNGQTGTFETMPVVLSSSFWTAARRQLSEHSPQERSQEV